MKTLLLCFFLLNLYHVYPQKIDTAVIQSMEVALTNGSFPNIHSILIAHNNKLVYEKYWAGKDKRWAKDIGLVAHGKNTLHDCQSITKSVVSICIGIALDQKKIKGIHQKVFEFFPEYSLQDTGLKAGINIKDLLTMTAGFKWNEDDYNSPDNSEHLMGASADPAGYMFALPMVAAPGKVFTYNGGATQLLTHIIQKATNKNIEEFAREYLFKPLGISNLEWIKFTASGLPDATSGLRLTSADMLKLGLLYMNEGKWKGEQVVPARWVKESVSPYIIADDGSDSRFGSSKYGYQIWLLADTIMNKPTPIAAFIGNGGQRIFIDKSNKVVVVFTGGNYRRPDIYLNPYNILREFVYPALFKKIN